ncbi:hypothetical protein OHT52_11010 [Streptomyces sp. NBC_00247]|uniref:hypothetical protein n=1 Tax=Streptomyces sp. NBC_00247 TaxID=2975689 RepID=UPI002E29839F|nr:hypothetical protein [Streptomyces sp. NBC_00247]
MGDHGHRHAHGHDHHGHHDGHNGPGSGERVPAPGRRTVLGAAAGAMLFMAAAPGTARAGLR